MIEVKPEWMEENAPNELVERLIDGIYEYLESCRYPYHIVHIGDLMAQVGFAVSLNSGRPLDDVEEEENELWTKAIYTAARQGRIALLSGSVDQFTGFMNPVDHEKPAEEQSMLASALAEPDGRVQVFAILREW